MLQGARGGVIWLSRSMIKNRAKCAVQQSKPRWDRTGGLRRAMAPSVLKFSLIYSILGFYVLTVSRLSYQKPWHVLLIVLTNDDWEYIHGYQRLLQSKECSLNSCIQVRIINLTGEFDKHYKPSWYTKIFLN